MSRPARPVDMEKIRKTCPVFRVLIIGRANAGKTTILQKVCNVDKNTKPVVYDANGRELKDWNKHGSRWSKFKNRLHPSSWKRTKPSGGPTGSESSAHSESDSEMSDTDILQSSTQRGRHNIRNQITYPGSRFIFHDSRGIESGSVDELQIIHEFIRERASKQSLAERLHAIWFCVPMDNRRPLVDAELSFFNENTENVPVVVVFTKFDALLDRVANDLGIINLTEHSKIAVSEAAEAIYQEHYTSRVTKAAYPPKGVVRLQEMNKAETNCHELSEKTAAVIDDLSLRQLFVSVQQNNLNLCMQEAARVSREPNLDEITMIRNIWAMFPHIWGLTENKPEQWVKSAGNIREHAAAWEWAWWEAWWEEAEWLMKELINMYDIHIHKHENTMGKSSVKEQLATAAIIIGADSFSMWKIEDNPWRWSFERYKSATQVQKQVRDMVDEQFDETGGEEAQAQLILQIANSALGSLKVESDKILVHEEEIQH